jgi:hypothetical protein
VGIAGLGVVNGMMPKGAKRFSRTQTFDSDGIML